MIGVQSAVFIKEESITAINIDYINILYMFMIAANKDFDFSHPMLHISA